MSLESEVGRGVYDAIDFAATAVSTEILAAYGRGDFPNLDEDTVRAIAKLAQSTVQKSAGRAAESLTLIVSKSS